MLTFLKELFGIGLSKPAEKSAPVVEKAAAPVVETSVKKPAAKKPAKKAGAGRPKKAK